MHVVVVGPGKVGSCLAKALGDADLFGRGGPIPSADVVVLAVPPVALPDVIARLPAGVPALHTAGALGPDALAPHSPRGVFHPLMTFPGPRTDLAGVPVRIDGDPIAVTAARYLAVRLGMVPFSLPGDPVLYHAAAVMAGNFATVLLAQAAAVLAAAGISEPQAAALLAPLAEASIRNAATDPAAALTGPAARGDRSAADDHVDALERAGLFQQAEIYKSLSKIAFELANTRTNPDRDRT